MNNHQICLYLQNPAYRLPVHLFLIRTMLAKLTFILITFFINLSLYAFDVKNGEINIESNSLNVDINKKTAEFNDNVILQQNNVKIFSDKLLITTKNNEVEQIIFLKNVKLQIKNKIILGDKAEYTKKDNILKIHNNVIYKNNNNEIIGDSFTHNFNNNISKLSSKLDNNNKKRVKAKFKISQNASS